MKMIGLYLKDRKVIVLMVVLITTIFAVVNILYNAPLAGVGYSLELVSVIMLIMGSVDFFHYYKKHKILQKHYWLNEIYTLENIQAQNVIEQDYINIAERLIEQKDALTRKSANLMADMKDYYAIWAHQIKIPISAMNLLLQVQAENAAEGEYKNAVKEMRQEMFKVDFYVDAVMNYLRLEDLSSDFRFVQVSLQSIVNGQVKRFASQFIHKHIFIDIKDIDRVISTDEKWLGFLIGQLLSNAVKYTRENGKVKIYLKETFNAKDCILVIEDNGIGIASEDLPRIMERGYTGLNGRGVEKSSGIGLYLCKKTADKLGIGIAVESQIHIGTKVYLNLSQPYNVHE